MQILNAIFYDNIGVDMQALKGFNKCNDFEPGGHSGLCSVSRVWDETHFSVFE